LTSPVPVRRALLGLASVLIILCGAVDVAVSSDGQETQFWPELDGFRSMDSHTRLRFVIAPVREVSNGQRSGLSDVDFGVDVDVGLLPIARAWHEPARYDNYRMNYLRLRAGLHYLDVQDANSEWRVVVEITPRAVLPLDTHLEFRNRFDLRWIEGAYSWRYRPRLKLEREFKIGEHMALVPYGSAETFWDSRSEAWIRTKYELGSGAAVQPWFSPEVYWAHQIDDAPAGDTITDALGIALRFFF
jgi:hypothetical protein